MLKLLFRIVFQKSMIIHLKSKEEASIEVTSYIFKIRSGRLKISDIHKGYINSLGKGVFKWPVLIIISGNGVVEKTINTSTSSFNYDRIENNPDILLSKTTDGLEKVSFIRRELVKHNMEDIEKFKLQAFDLLIIKNIESYNIESVVNNFFCTKDIFKATDKKEYLFRVLYDISKLWVLIIFLISLSVNYFIFQGVENDYRLNKGQVEILKNLSQQKKDESKSVNLLLNNLPSGTLKLWNTYILDQIAGILPKEVLLNKLVISPKSKQGNDDKILNYDYDLVVIDGESISPENITRFINSLSNLHFIKNVHLTSIIENKKEKNFLFEVEIEITL